METKIRLLPLRAAKTIAFKDQDMEFLSAPATAEDAYIEYPTSKWLGDEKGFYLMRLSRDLKRHDLCYVGVDADSTKMVLREQLNTYVETRNPKFIKGGSQFIWWSERNGWANLYLYNSDGSLVRNLTEGAFHVEDILGVNEAAGYVLFSACGVDKDENPYQMHNYKVSLSGGAIQQLDMKDMDVLATASYDARYFVANYSRVDCAPAVALYNAVTGRKVLDLEEADLRLLLEAGYKFPERFKVKAADGITDLYGAMYKPFDFDSTKVYPILDYVYPGPQVEANNISWSKGFTRVDRLAQVGFIVITVGNRGGHPNRSKWYHNYGYGNLPAYGVPSVMTADGPAGLRISRDYCVDEKGVHALGDTMPESILELLSPMQRKLMAFLTKPRKQPGEIKHQFCTANFNIQFPQFDKIDVNGKNESPLYTYLKSQKSFGGFNLKDKLGSLLDGMLRKQDVDYDKKPSIKWNFTKFLIDQQGRVVKRYEPTDSMEKVGKDIEQML